MDAREGLKREAAMRAVDEVRPGMRVGLGTGSTARHVVDLLGARVRDGGLDIVGVPTSEATRRHAEAAGVRLTTLDEEPELDLAIDGADEIDPALSLIKGGGGALLKEKIVAAASRALIVVADDSKVVAQLGRFPLPIEVIPFGLGATRRAVARAAAEVGCHGDLVLRKTRDGHVFVTEAGHFLLDAGFGAIPDPAALAERLAAIPGVVEHGLFVGLARRAYVAAPGGVRVLVPG